MVMRETIGGYRILGKLGSGGFGVVSLARSPLDDRDVALKVLTDRNDLERFRREARLAYEIDHPNVIDILHYGEDGGACFIVMELMPISLREILKNGRLSLSRSVDICRQAALGLRAAHERGVIHRDVKPDNILIDSKGTVKVSDFGIAHADDLPSLTTTGTWIGAGRYMSPEQFMDSKRVDARTDVYSLGVTFYEMLTGNGYELGKSAKASHPAIPGDLERIVNKCLEMDRERRYESMDALLQEITTPSLINRCALIDFYEATGGLDWKRNDNWLTDKALDDWYGVTSDRDGEVTRIDVSSNDLEGKIPSEITHLTKLDSFTLRYNRLSGNVPPELGSLTELATLVLSDNSLSGSIPPELGNLTKLNDLNLSSNRLSGSIPPELGNLTKLDVLYLSFNDLSGSIPPELGNLTKLTVLNLSSNRLSGNIPPELGNLAKLDSLFLGWNGLSGSIPPELGNSTKLVILELAGNGLSGSIPPELGNLTELGFLELGGNGLSGSIPPELGNLTKLETLDLRFNDLSGSIPPELVNLTKLEALYFYGNNWTGCISRSLFDIPDNDLGDLDLPVCDR